MVLINETGRALTEMDKKEILSLIGNLRSRGVSVHNPTLIRPGVVTANCVAISHTGILYLDSRVYYPGEGDGWTPHQEFEV